MVTDESPLNLLFRPEEVELLVCGSKVGTFFCSIQKSSLKKMSLFLFKGFRFQRIGKVNRI